MEQTSSRMGRVVPERRPASEPGLDFHFSGYAGLFGLAGVAALLVFALVSSKVSLRSLVSFGRHDSAAVVLARTQQADAKVSSEIFATTDDAQNMWIAMFTEKGQSYQRADVVLFHGSTYSSCGSAEAEIGPFYCPAEEKIYVDLDFWNDLKQAAGNNAALAEAYVLGHEMGHHVQHQMAMREGIVAASRGVETHAAVLTNELRADCYAGVWAHSADERGVLQAGNVGAAMRAATAVGDARLQQMSGRAVSPERWTADESAQREQWFMVGLKSGESAGCSSVGSVASR
ncbi:MAG: neutral zinc metallopeptidase [Acidobacteriota bacterium]